MKDVLAEWEETQKETRRQVAMLRLMVDELENRSEDVSVAKTDSTPPRCGGLDPLPSLEVLSLLNSSKTPKMPPIAEEVTSSAIPSMMIASTVLRNSPAHLAMSLPPVAS